MNRSELFTFYHVQTGRHLVELQVRINSPIPQLVNTLPVRRRSHLCIPPPVSELMHCDFPMMSAPTSRVSDSRGGRRLVVCTWRFRAHALVITYSSAADGCCFFAGHYDGGLQLVIGYHCGSDILVPFPDVDGKGANFGVLIWESGVVEDSPGAGIHVCEEESMVGAFDLEVM